MISSANMIEVRSQNENNGSIYLGVLFSLLIHLIFFGYSGNVFLWQDFQQGMSQQAIELKEAFVADMTPLIASSTENAQAIRVRLAAGPSAFSIEYNQSDDLESILSGLSEAQEDGSDFIERQEPILPEKVTNNSEITDVPFERSDLTQTPQESIEELTGALSESRQVAVQFPPVYPMDAQLNKWQGVVELGFWIARNGSVRDIEVISSSGHQSLDSSAMDAVRLWQYDITGIAASLPQRKTMRFVFKLDEYSANK